MLSLRNSMILNDLLNFEFNLEQWTISDVRIDISRFRMGGDAILIFLKKDTL